MYACGVCTERQENLIADVENLFEIEREKEDIFKLYEKQ